jgi:hypothetical protein
MIGRGYCLDRAATAHTPAVSGTQESVRYSRSEVAMGGIIIFVANAVAVVGTGLIIGLNSVWILLSIIALIGTAAATLLMLRSRETRSYGVGALLGYATSLFVVLIYVGYVANAIGD